MLHKLVGLVALGFCTAGVAFAQEDVPPAKAAEAPADKPAQEKVSGSPGHFKEVDQEIETLGTQIFGVADEDKDGKLSPKEEVVARQLVAAAMRETLPKSSFISGGQVVVEYMERQVLNKVMDLDRNHDVTPLELRKFIAQAIGVRMRTLRSPIEAQFWISEQELSRNNFNRQNKEALQENRLAQTEWMRMAHQQRHRVYYESEMIKRIMAAEQQRDWIKRREREKNQPMSPGESAKAEPETKPAEMPPAEAAPEAKP